MSRADDTPVSAQAAEPPHPAGAPLWLRSASDTVARLLVLGVGLVALVYALGYLRLVVLPVIVAMLLTTLLLPLARWLRGRGLADGLAAAGAMLAFALGLVLVATAIAPSIGGQTDRLGTGVEDGVREAADVLSHEPFNLSRKELNDRVDEGIASLRENTGPITHGVQRGAIVLGEIVTGLIVTVLLTFFFLKDGRRIWEWLIGLLAGRRRDSVDEMGTRVFAALAGYVRGLALVGLVDAVLIGLALLLIGVPLVVPLMILTFFAAFLPLVGATLAGLAAVLIALVFNGFVAALFVLGAIVLVQQVEGHLLYPLLMSRTVHLHPAAIIIALATGGVVAGIIGVFLAVPTAGAISVVIAYLRNRPEPQPPLAEPEASAAAAAG